MASWKITDGSYKGLTFHLAVPDRSQAYGVMSQDVTNERRIQVSEKALLDGADLQDFGRKAKVFTAEVIFYGGDYRSQLKTFEDLLDEPSTGTLILPDHAAVKAKYIKHTRKSSANEGDTTVLSVTWMEDHTSATPSPISRADQEAQEANIAQTEYGAAKVEDKAQGLLALSKKGQELLANNPVLTKINQSLASATAQRVSINSVTNLTRDAVALVNTTAKQTFSTLDSLAAATNGLLHVTELLKFDLESPNPTRFNTALGLVDFTAPAVGTTTTVSGAEKVVKAPPPTLSTVTSYEDAAVQMKKMAADLAVKKNVLEKSTQGSTKDFSVTAVAIINQINDIVALVGKKSTKQVLTTTQTSMLEVCFEHGVPTKDIGRVFQLNLALTDTLDIPPLTVVNL